MGATFLSETKPRAKVEHRCHGCLQKIAVGERHVAASFAIDGRAFTSRWHLACDLLLDDLLSNGVLEPNDQRELDEGCLIEYLGK